jgi:hypothetical protein
MSKRTAILVIHGMGTQKPYETLDQFARGVMKVRPSWTSKIEYRQHGSDPAGQQKAWTQAFVRLRPSDPADESIIDLVEYYWAPIINGRVKALQSLRFLMLTALSPFDYLRTNMLAINQVSGLPDTPHGLAMADPNLKVCPPDDVAQAMGAHQIKREGFSNCPAKQVGFILLREVYRSVLIFFPLLLLLAAVYGFVAQPVASLLMKGPNADWFKYFWVAPKPGWKDVVEIAAMSLRWLLIGMGVRYFWDAWKRPEARTAQQDRAIKGCNLGVALLVGTLFVLPFLLEWHGLPWWRGFAPFSGRHAHGSRLMFLANEVRAFLHTSIVFAPMRLRLVHMAFYAILGVLSYKVNRFLTTAAGDLAVYLGADTLSENFAARSQILSECTAAMCDLLGKHCDLLPLGTQPGPDEKGDPYDNVIIAAHSLGSVIAYDMLNDLMAKNRVDTKDKPQLERITGMLTFGCPLNKIYYFFRSRTEQRTTILNRILYDLHNFRVRIAPPPDAIKIPEPFAQPFCWYNAWSPRDVISGRMFFYRADKNRMVKKGILPWTAHTSYWGNPDLYTFFEELL